MTWILGLSLFQLVCEILTFCLIVWNYRLVSKQLDEAQKYRDNLDASSKKTQDLLDQMRAARKVKDQ